MNTTNSIKASPLLVTAFVGSARKKFTFNAAEYFLKSLQSHGNIEYEIVRLSDYKLEICKGCQTCFERGEEMCPLKDDRDLLLQKISDSDGIIFASPNYSFDVSGYTKVFLDRLGFVFHRPCYFGKAFTSIVIQGFYRGNKIIKYFNFLGKGLGFTVINGSCLNSLEPMTEKDQKRFNKVLEKQSDKFYTALTKRQYPIPNILQLMFFRIARTSIRLVLNESCKDYNYFNQNGWFESDYYYKTSLNPLKKLTGKLFDYFFAGIYRKKI